MSAGPCRKTHHHQLHHHHHQLLLLPLLPWAAALQSAPAFQSQLQTCQQTLLLLLLHLLLASLACPRTHPLPQGACLQACQTVPHAQCLASCLLRLHHHHRPLLPLLLFWVLSLRALGCQTAAARHRPQRPAQLRPAPPR